MLRPFLFLASRTFTVIASHDFHAYFFAPLAREMMTMMDCADYARTAWGPGFDLQTMTPEQLLPLINATLPLMEQHLARLGLNHLTLRARGYCKQGPPLGGLTFPGPSGGRALIGHLRRTAEPLLHAWSLVTLTIATCPCQQSTIWWCAA